ncbi:SgcJ/EcaC family oxidoreductase [Ochrobactrum teleogrylli]|uniref:SgcJ/EcaC family oxidoreductase n=2 Tax=Ochrobactrum teleogrylli TaxID=2479765 RepID=A0ABY2Y6A5_9HYPH|nr:SgcJ/EcaC family oxidoreductase [[Ochrobactrum] teleogrylli]TNV16017.1 SgcJ/EcaC family oxidoreductase [[Ochrobactrum] teleogrylli]
MKKLLLVLLSLVLALSPELAFASKGGRVISYATRTCEAIDREQVEALFDRWNETLKTGDAKRVAANYAHDAVLLPTLSNQARLTDRERIDYFEGFLKKGPVGHIDTRTIRLGCNKAIDTGTYTFTYKDGTHTAARYTFTYAWNGKEWLITSHHSSALPETM